MKTKQYTKNLAQKGAYNGAQFDSKLEMKWAMMFELCGYDWEREPFTIQNPVDSDLTWVPDFKITHKETGKSFLVEVKPKGAFFNIEKTKLARLRGNDCLLVTNNPQDTTAFCRIFANVDLTNVFPQDFLQLWETVAFM